MKRFLYLFIACILLLSCSACGNHKETVPKKPSGDMVMKDEAGNVRITIDDIESVNARTITLTSGETSYVVELEFTEEGAVKFGDVTTELMGMTLGIYVDGELICEPKINEAITQGSSVINVDTYEEARELADKIQGD
ncbi:MAG: hypothetical protein IJ648_03520 [Lachnospiraceae bacterium]|nr:hypothetical protein [Lachnospiraceae bacterium]